MGVYIWNNGLKRVKVKTGYHSNLIIWVIPFSLNYQEKRLKSLNKIKACVPYFLSNVYFSPNDSTLKTMKNVFYFI